MAERDVNQTIGGQYKHNDYALNLRPPGRYEISVPSAFHFMDIYLGRIRGTYMIEGLEAMGEECPAASFVYLPANGERLVRAVRSGWSVQLFISDAMFKRVLETQQAIDSLGVRSICHGFDDAIFGLAQMMKSMQDLRTEPPPQGHVHAFALLIAERVTHFFCSFAETRAKGVANSKRIQDVLDYIEEHLGDPLTLQDLSAVASMSPYHFARVFRRVTSYSAHQYVIERRLERAKRMLASSDEKIADIASACGFGSQSHMTDVFKRVLGFTPGSVRRNLK